MRFLSINFFVAAFIGGCAPTLFAGCASKKSEGVVFLPQKCEIDTRARPAKTGVTAVDVVEILKYTEEIESDLKFCRGR